MKVTIVAWGSELLQFSGAAREAGIALAAWQVHELKDDPEKRRRCIESCNGADVVLIHPSHDPVWDEILGGLGEGVPVIPFGYTDASWSASTVPLAVVSTVSAYFLYGGPENIGNLIRYVQAEVAGMDVAYDPPRETRWEGIYHPDVGAVFDDPDVYLAWYPSRHSIRVGLLFSRTHWVNGDLAVEDALIRELEKHYDVLPVFCFGVQDQGIGARSDPEVIDTFFKGRISALIDARTFTPPRDGDACIKALENLGVPVLHPLILYHRTEAEWRADTDGMRGSDVSWYVALPEFLGAIEMLPVGAAESRDPAGTEGERHVPIAERVEKFVGRVGKWIDLAASPPAERRVAFILHNKPCASVEATVGAGAHLDTLESVARILRAMRDQGYAVECPESGRDLIEAIMNRKAVSDFRWTSVEEIVRRGGALALIEPDDYAAWFETLPPEVRTRICEAWGQPPGEEVNGVPPAMIYEGKIVVTGVRFGNAIVCVQPKRGCAGPRCDGEVCRILHDPGVPPTHQYLATYRYIEETFGADVIVHVGTHGNLEFLPGKSVAPSDACFPDIAIGTIPHLYIYNADNPPEGTLAKRRSYATLIDHMQTVMVASDLYAGLKELEEQIADYNRAKEIDRARTHALEHTIVDLLEQTGIADEIGFAAMHEQGAPFEEVVGVAHTAITRIADTRIPEGMHIFGEVPEGERRVEFIHAVMRYDGEVKGAVLRMMGHDASTADDALLRDAEVAAKALIAAILAGETPERAAERALSDRLRRHDHEALETIRAGVLDIEARIDDSDEIGSLLSGFAGGYIPPGPSGLITRGKPEVLPTGRNFYSLDPFRVPTRAAWRIGMRLAESVVAKYVDEHGRVPENIGMYWMASDIMWADGEQLSQTFSLIGVEPVWTDGRVRSYRVIPLEELGRPRIDVTVRMSGILRDCFYTSIELLDDAIREVATLDEPPEMNFIRKHALQGRGTARIFGSRPGTYGNGVSLAVYASAWKEDADLAEVFVRWNSYAYGRGSFGEESPETFSAQLAAVDLTFNKTVTDEYDLLGCCCYFGTHGGLTGAARALSNRDVPAYYGDTRDRDRVEVRTLAEEVRRVVRARLLNPQWIEGMKRHGYKGAGDISRQVGTVYGWEATTQEVDDRIFDDIARTFVLDPEMRRFFEDENPWALEEIGRRLLEAHERGLWDANPDVLEGLRAAYLEMEGWIEDRMGDAGGEVQGGAVRVVTVKDVKALRGAREKE
ncbi:cobaltochelatase subunit CobN [Methanoculleus sp.]|uniref:cobaltochelatase subunit CobN n=1 Tax=Methanoculleus sp. TaxID=90427 RepID=UPI001BD3FB87|nr:cobaltochelatase subunit CobN [Methanoculleus sp.]